MSAALNKLAPLEPPSLAELRQLPKDLRSARIDAFRNSIKELMDSGRRIFLGRPTGDLDRSIRDVTASERTFAEANAEYGDSISEFRSVLTKYRASGLADPATIAKDQASLEDAIVCHRLIGTLVQSFRDMRQQLESKRRERLARYAFEWNAYLARLDEDAELRNLAPHLREFWAWISRKLWAPEGVPFEDGYLMTWDRGAHRLQVVLEESSFAWSFYNRDTREFISEEGLTIGRFSEGFKAAIRRMTKG